MVRKRARSSASPSPMVRSVVPRMPKYNIKGSISDQTVLSGNRRVTHTTAAGAGHATISLDILSSRTLDPISDVGQLYRQFKYLPGTAYVHVPSVSLTSTGTVAIAFIDNPEQYQNWLALANDGIRYDFVTSIGNHKAFPIWKEFAFPLTAPPRRLTFDTNATPSATPGVDEFERSWQGAFVISFAGVTPADGAVSRAYLHQVIQLRGLCGSAVA